MTVGEGKGIMHTGFHFMQKAIGFKSFLASNNIYVLQQTNKRPVTGIGKGERLEMLRHWKLCVQAVLPR